MSCSKPKKTVYLIRHGQSLHNVYEVEATAASYKDPNIFDSDLSSLGVEQATALAEITAPFIDQVELVVVSPLTRSIQTCLKAGFFSKKKPILVSPMCREQVTNGCDLGLLKSDLVNKFPELNFDLIDKEMWWYIPPELKADIRSDNYTEMWKKHPYIEPEDYLFERVEMFRQWLRDRPEQLIVVVGHSNFFRRFLGMVDILQNCEVYKTTV